MLLAEAMDKPTPIQNFYGQVQGLATAEKLKSLPAGLFLDYEVPAGSVLVVPAGWLLIEDTTVKCSGLRLSYIDPQDKASFLALLAATKAHDKSNPFLVAMEALSSTHRATVTVTGYHEP